MGGGLFSIFHQKFTSKPPKRSGFAAPRPPPGYATAYRHSSPTILASKKQTSNNKMGGNTFNLTIFYVPDSASPFITDSDNIVSFFEL